MELYPCHTNMLPPGTARLLRPQYLQTTPLEETAGLWFVPAPYQIQSTSSRGHMTNGVFYL